MLRRRCQPILVAALAVAVAGCGDSGDDDAAQPEPPPRTSGELPPPPRPPREERVALTLDPTTARPGETLRLTIENRGDRTLEYGVAYRLERWDGRWKWLNRDSAFILIAKVVRPGGVDREQIELPTDLRPGLHRIVKSFRTDGTRREFTAAARFTVR